MMRFTSKAIALAVVMACTVSNPSWASPTDDVDRDARAALRTLEAANPTAAMLAKRAKAILVFPTMLKAGFVFGGQIGDGALLRHDRTLAYYNSVSASYGFQAGVQTFGYALFFMNDAALAQLDATHGLEIGVGPSVVLVDQGISRTLSTTTLTSDVYAFVFDQQGLMAGAGIQGTKITRLDE